jgi:hypothetical protein
VSVLRQPNPVSTVGTTDTEGRDQWTGPLVLAGMHRSRTSTVAMCLGGVGVDLGANLVPADERNPSGYGEDEDVVALHRHLLGVVEVGATDGLTWRDWGFPDDGTIGRPLAPHAVAEVRRYVERRARNAARGAWAWGWKDPRTTLFLDSWAELVPEARFVLLYRSPVGVATSLRRLPLPPAVQLRANDVWRMYNECLVRFGASHPERTIVVDTDRFLRAPHLVLRHILDRLGAAVAPQAIDDAVAASLDPALGRRSLADDEREEIPAELATLWARLQELDDVGPLLERRSIT